MNIAVRRGLKGMTQSDLAKHLGISRSSVAMWESRQITPKVETLKKLAELFGCTVDDLLREEQTTTPTRREENGMNLIKMNRMRLGYTQGDFAKVIGAPVSTVCMWENGNSYPNVRRFPKLAELFGCHVEDLINGWIEFQNKKKNPA